MVTMIHDRQSALDQGGAVRALLVDYRAMHFSAKRGIAIACRLSVRLSVCNVGGL